MNRFIRNFLIVAAVCLISGCRGNVAVSIGGRPAVAVQVSPQTLDGNTLDATIKAADEINAVSP